MPIGALLFNAGDAGAKALQFSIDPMPGEENRLNNAVTRLVNVESDKRRILYVEGEPRWEYKFIRRAEDNDEIVQVASMLRTTENKIYRQGINDPKDLANGFPSIPMIFLDTRRLSLGSVEAGYFTPAQKDLIRQFVDRRGGGLLLLGGRYALSDGGWGASELADPLPVSLPNRKNTFQRDPATVELTPAGADSLICRLVDDPARNAERWKTLPYLMDHQDPGTPKPGRYGAGSDERRRAHDAVARHAELRTRAYRRACHFAVRGGGRWVLPLGDTSHDMFWRQLLRWLVADTPDRVVASVPHQNCLTMGTSLFPRTCATKIIFPPPTPGPGPHYGPGQRLPRLST